ncbi:MAG: CpsD/CapB family tyrosine-protein kinase [Rubrobacteraceae bacterium]|nr:CpsD/CapB family tyrosine-protein kinase [Rubrobacteraceae bacterium]
MILSRKSTRRRQAKQEARSGDFSGRLVTSLDTQSPASEDYRTLRTSLLYALVDEPPKLIMVSSPGPMEGKSTTSANLGVVLAQANKSTLLVDCDLRKPIIHKIFGLKNLWGIVNVLVGERSLEDVQQHPMEGLQVVTSGPLPPDPAALLSSRRFSNFLEEARQRFDYVLLDVPPTEIVSDPVTVAAQADGVLLVFDAQNTRKGAVRRSVRNLESVGATVLGTVMNNVKASGRGYYGYSYGYKYG